MMQIHTLTFIDDCPGITATQLSKIWHKSKSAISQTIKKLIESGYVEKRYMENNEKTARLYVTEKGKRLSSVHKAYDIADITQTTAYLIEQCSEADLEAFYRIVEQYTKLLKEEL
jgi:DNA-binding MarR family transcriptional regulator